MAKEDGVNSLRVSGHHFGSIVHSLQTFPMPAFYSLGKLSDSQEKSAGRTGNVAYGDMALSFHKLDQLI